MAISSFSHLEIDGVSAELRVRTAESEERVHEPPVLSVTCEAFKAGADRAPLEPEALLGKKATLTLAGDGADAVLEGVVDAVRLHATGMTVTIVHPMAGLARAVDHRAFVEKDAIAIAKTILGEHDLAAEVRVPESPKPRHQCVQAWESDLAFVGRLLAEEGITLLAELGPGAPISFAEGAAAFHPVVGEERLPCVASGASGMTAAEHVSDVRLRHRVAPTRVSVRDYDFEKPALDLTAEAGEGGLAHVAFGSAAHGGASATRYRDVTTGKAVAGKRLAALRREAHVLEGSTTSPRVGLGKTFVLHGAPREDLNRKWLVVELRRRLTEPAAGAESRGAGERYRATFSAVKADDGYRPAVPAAPSMGGLATATVTGASGQEISTDAHGRVTGLLRYDRRGSKDDKSSTALRVLHPPTSGGFLLPRVGWEALVAFVGASGDEPYVLGRLGNGAAPPAESLPGKKICSNFGTPTTPGGGSANMLRMNDSAGSEEMTVVASSNYDEQTAANKKTGVGGSESRTVGANRELACDVNRALKVGGAQSITVGANRRETAGAGIVVGSASETVIVAGTRNFSVGGDQTSLVKGALTRLVGGAKVALPLAGNNRHVDAASTVLVGGAWAETGAVAAVSVAGLSNLASSAIGIKTGKYAMSATGLAENVGSRLESGAVVKLEAGGAIAMSFGATKLEAPTVHVKAGSITVNAGGGTLTVNPGSVTFKGDFKMGGHVAGKGKATHG